jgi:ABC-type nitrate/sulfonate/bicarbonate transport system permease component
MFFTRLAKKGFKLFFEILLWLNVVACSVLGGVIANFTYTYKAPFLLRHAFRSSSVHPVLGVFLGLVIGIFTSVLIGGFVAHLLKLDDRKGH